MKVGELIRRLQDLVVAHGGDAEVQIHYIPPNDSDYPDEDWFQEIGYVGVAKGKITFSGGDWAAGRPPD